MAGVSILLWTRTRFTWVFKPGKSTSFFDVAVSTRSRLGLLLAAIHIAGTFSRRPVQVTARGTIPSINPCRRQWLLFTSQGYSPVDKSRSLPGMSTSFSEVMVVTRSHLGFKAVAKLAGPIGRVGILPSTGLGQRQISLRLSLMSPSQPALAWGFYWLLFTTLQGFSPANQSRSPPGVFSCRPVEVVARSVDVSL